jgi:hypothetical protein
MKADRMAEIMDFGYPQNSETDTLKMYITTEGIKSELAVVSTRTYGSCASYCLPCHVDKPSLPFHILHLLHRCPVGSS